MIFISCNEVEGIVFCRYFQNCFPLVGDLISRLLLKFLFLYFLDFFDHTMANGSGDVTKYLGVSRPISVSFPDEHDKLLSKKVG